MPEQADTLYRQLDELDELRSLYLFMLVWGLPEYEKLDPSERERFSELVKSGTLFAYVETQKRTVLATGLDVPGSWLGVLSAAHLVPDAPLPDRDRAELAAVLRGMWPTLCRLSVAAQASGQTSGRGPGRRPATDLQADASLHDAWATGEYLSYLALADATGNTERGVRMALERHRKRRARRAVK